MNSQKVVLMQAMACTFPFNLRPSSNKTNVADVLTLLLMLTMFFMIV